MWVKTWEQSFWSLKWVEGQRVELKVMEHAHQSLSYFICKTRLVSHFFNLFKEIDCCNNCEQLLYSLLWHLDAMKWWWKWWFGDIKHNGSCATLWQFCSQATVLSAVFVFTNHPYYHYSINSPKKLIQKRKNVQLTWRVRVTTFYSSLTMVCSFQLLTNFSCSVRWTSPLLFVQTFISLFFSNWGVCLSSRPCMWQWFSIKPFKEKKVPENAKGQLETMSR